MKSLGKRILVIGASLMLVLGMAPPTQANSTLNALTDWNGAGAATGTLVFGEPLPGYLKACARDLPFEVKITAPAFAYKTPSGEPVVAPLNISGTGITQCASESVFGSYGFTVSITAGDLVCPRISAGAMQTFGWISVMAGSSSGCTFRGESAQSWGWTFQGAWAKEQMAGAVVYGL